MGDAFFRLPTRREMPLKEMIQRTVVKQDLQKMNATWYIINCDASETGISYFKEKPRFGSGDILTLQKSRRV